VNYPFNKSGLQKKEKAETSPHNLISREQNYFSFMQHNPQTTPFLQEHHASVDISLRHRLENLKKK